MEIQDPKGRDFAGLLTLSFVWGSSFTAIETALRSFGPFAIAGGRITVAALFLTLLAVATGHHFPRQLAVWARLYVIGVTGTALPFVLIAWGQQSVNSSLAAILMALTPLNTLLVAHIATHDERLSRRKVTGLVIGFLGVTFLFASGGRAGPAGILAVGAIYLATVNYAVSAVQIRKLGALPPVILAAGVMICAGTIALPLAFLVEDPDLARAAPLSIAAIVYLGIFSSGLAVVLMAWLIRRTGVIFLSLNNYLVPVVGIVLGMSLLGEVLGLTSLLAFALIITGVAITTRSRTDARPGPAAEVGERPAPPQL